MPRLFNAQNVREAAAQIGDTSGYSIARRTGLSESTISRLFSGEYQPRATTQDRFLNAYKIHIDELMTDHPNQVAA